MIIAIKEALQDRINLLTEEFKAHGDSDMPWQQRWKAGYIEGRLEEAHVCLRIFEKLRIDEEHPLLALDVKSGKWARVPWGKQSRGNWPQSTFGVADEAEPGVHRHDPGRC
jgi:hypothetical protein